MEKRLLPFWEGSGAPSNGRIVEAESRWGLGIATDYDRSCDIADWSGLIEVGDGLGLVLSIENHSTTWIPATGDTVGTLVEWGFADSESDILEELRQLTVGVDIEGPKIWEIESGSVVLFAAAESGLEPIYQRLEFELVPGRYRILSGERKTVHTFIIGHQFKVEK